MGNSKIIGGGETYTYQLAYGFKENDHETFVLTGKHPTRKPADFPFECIELPGFSDVHLEIERCIPAMYSALLDIDPEIIHVHNYLPYFVYEQIAGDFPRAKIVLSIHNTPEYPCGRLWLQGQGRE